MAETEEGRKFEKIALDYLKQNNLSEAESNFLQALEHMKQSGDEEGQAYVLGNLGNLCFQSRRLDKAQEYYGKALTYMEKVNDIRGIESSLGNLGSVFFYKGSLDEAEETYKKALKFLEEANDSEGQSIYNENLETFTSRRMISRRQKIILIGLKHYLILRRIKTGSRRLKIS